MAKLPPVTASFAEGQYFDLWMLVHFASGAAGGYSNVYFELPVPLLYALGFILMVIWEAGEYLKKVRESWTNRILDITVGMLGVALAEWTARFLLPSQEFVAFVATLGAGLVGLAFGVRARRRRDKLKASEASAS